MPSKLWNNLFCEMPPKMKMDGWFHETAFQMTRDLYTLIIQDILWNAPLKYKSVCFTRPSNPFQILGGITYTGLPLSRNPIKLRKAVKFTTCFAFTISPNSKLPLSSTHTSHWLQLIYSVKAAGLCNIQICIKQPGYPLFMWNVILTFLHYI